MSMQTNPKASQGAMSGPGAVRGPSPMPGGGNPRAILMRGEKPRDFKGTMKKLIQYLGSYQLLILVTMIFAFASTIFSIFGPKLLGNATHHRIVHRSNGQNRRDRYDRFWFYQPYRP